LVARRTSADQSEDARATAESSLWLALPTELSYDEENVDLLDAASY
jgi:hypothetical protein